METRAFSAPSELDSLGVERRLLDELALKIAHVSGETSIQELAGRMGLKRSVTNEIFQHLRRDQLCEVTGMTAGMHRFALTAAGKSRAVELLALCQYTGPAPVSLRDYVQMIRAQSVRSLPLRPSEFPKHFEQIVVDDETLARLGTAAVSGQSLFLYGPTGSGKTTIAETLAGVFTREPAMVPHAVVVDGQIIAVYDPTMHQRAAMASDPSHDQRWVFCKRPKVVVGGELTVEMLDLQFNTFSRFYTAPLQMKANNGVLIIDDFGRQRLRPDELLNRWVIPLDRRIDYLTLLGGLKIEIPFDVFVIFATNLDPTTLVDQAFLRRIQTKVKIDEVTPVQFHEIFRRVCKEMSLPYDARVVGDLIDTITHEWKIPLRACYPRDLARQICWEARYQEHPPQLNRDTVARACRNYFVPSLAPGSAPQDASNT